MPPRAAGKRPFLDQAVEQRFGIACRGRQGRLIGKTGQGNRRTGIEHLVDVVGGLIQRREPGGCFGFAARPRRQAAALALRAEFGASPPLGMLDPAPGRSAAAFVRSWDVFRWCFAHPLSARFGAAWISKATPRHRPPRTGLSALNNSGANGAKNSAEKAMDWE